MKKRKEKGKRKEKASAASRRKIREEEKGKKRTIVALQRYKGGGPGGNCLLYCLIEEVALREAPHLLGRVDRRSNCRRHDLLCHVSRVNLRRRVGTRTTARRAEQPRSRKSGNCNCFECIPLWSQPASTPKTVPAQRNSAQLR